ncbi:MAG: hypothetical protein WDN02_12760 [Methylovirgula sp.]|uniref:hypothetical protein n=1 Tax=Methylovirgula sp. TaxID=1978224 RepID=UPI0030765992
MKLVTIAFLLASSPAALAAQLIPPPLDLPVSGQVTQSNIHRTICKLGWTKLVRPSYSYTHRMKLQKLRQKGLSQASISRFELDHLIPLDLGGDPYSTNNLALEPWAEARRKDVVEYCLTSAVCAGSVRLTAAQRAIWEDWRRAGRLCRR